MPHESQVVGWPGRTLFDADGSKIGKIEDVFADERTGRPAWATVSSGLFGRRHHFVPIEQAREVQDGVAVPVAGQLVKGAPNVDADGDLSRDDERVLYRHYGLDDGELDGPDATPAAAPVDHDGDGRPDDDDHARGTHDPDARETDLAGDHDQRERRDLDDRRADRDAPGYTHHDERTRHDADGDGRDDRLEADGGDHRPSDPSGVDAGDHRQSDDRGDARDDHGTAPAAAGAGALTGGAHRAGTRDDERPDADDDRSPRGSREDDGRGPGVPPTLQADATTEALARAERERLAAEEAEHDRLAAEEAAHERPAAQESAPDRLSAREPAPPAGHEAPVLDRELAQQDLSVAPAVPDAAVVGRPHVDDGYAPRRDHAIDPTGGAEDASAGRPAPGRDDAATAPTPGTPDASGTTGSPAAGAPSAGTRLRRLVRSITPSKDDSHG